MAVRDQKHTRKKPQGAYNRVLFISILSGVLVSLAFLAVFSFVMTIRTIPENICSIVVAASAACGGFVCGALMALLFGRNGMINGLFSGLCMFVCLFVLGCITSFSIQFSTEVLIQLLCCTIAGGVGGLVMIGIMPKRKCQISGKRR